MKTYARLAYFVIPVCDFKYGFEQVQKLKIVRKKIMKEIKCCTKGCVSIQNIKFEGTDSGNISHAGASYFVKLKGSEQVLKRLEDQGWTFLETTKRDRVIDAITGALDYHFPYFRQVRKESGVREVAKEMADDIFEALEVSSKEQDARVCLG